MSLTVSGLVGPLHTLVCRARTAAHRIIPADVDTNIRLLDNFSFVKDTEPLTSIGD